MNHKCKKCKQTFVSEYLLNKHLNRKVPCDVVLKCDRCEVVFTNAYRLNRHKNRKNPCTIIDKKSDLEIKLEIEKLKAYNLEAMKKIDLDNKLTIIQEKSNKQKEKLEIEDKINKEKANKRLEVESKLIQERSKVMLEREKEKTKRKKITTAIANQNAAKRKEDKELFERKRLMKHIEKYQKINMYPFDSDEINNFLTNYIRDKDQLEEILDYIENNDIESIQKFIHKIIFDNKLYPEAKSLFYSSELNEYWGIIPVDDNNNNNNRKNNDKESSIKTIVKQLSFWSNVVRTVLIGESYSLCRISDALSMRIKDRPAEQSIVPYKEQTGSDDLFKQYSISYAKEYYTLTHDGQKLVNDLDDLDTESELVIANNRIEHQDINTYYEYKEKLTNSIKIAFE